MANPTFGAEAPLRVLVVDPDDRIRESLARLLPIGGRCLVVGSAGQPDLALELARSLDPHVAVVDSRIPAACATGDFVDCLRATVPGVRVVVLTYSDADPEARLGGADAYIRKTFRPHELIDAVIAAARPPAA
jgi:DNA-binding NarL/FixJ family response regulator